MKNILNWFVFKFSHLFLSKWKDQHLNDNFCAFITSGRSFFAYIGVHRGLCTWTLYRVKTSVNVRIFLMCKSKQLTIRALGISLVLLRSSACKLYKCTIVAVRSGQTPQGSRTDQNVECFGGFVPEHLPAAKFLLFILNCIWGRLGLLFCLKWHFHPS